MIPREEIDERNEAQAIDLLRYLPGLSVTATGARGAQTSLFIRGGDYDFNLVEIDGIPDQRRSAASFDFAHIPTDFLDHIEVIRGAAVGGLRRLCQQRRGEFRDAHARRKRGIATCWPKVAATMSAALPWADRERCAALASRRSASRLDDDGPVANSDYHNKNLFLS